MKIRVEIDPDIPEGEVVIKGPELNEEIISLQRQIAEAVNTQLQLHVTRQKTEYLLSLEEILFLETSDQIVAVHTRGEIFETKDKMYELEELLPGKFMRVSKSTIINTSKIRAIHKNITGASEVEFQGTVKKAYVSRNYIKALINKLEEKRLKNE